jgi:hypothetical protein
MVLLLCSIYSHGRSEVIGKNEVPLSRESCCWVEDGSAIALRLPCGRCWAGTEQLLESLQSAEELLVLVRHASVASL